VIAYGYDITPSTLPLASGEWDTTVHIMIRRPKGVQEKKFTGRETFTTRQEAVQFCLALGKKIIDGAIPNWSVADL
jgi:hypothetical protein